ncbi:MHYT domain-containing protein [Actinomadura sp. 7K507]|uniref:MHYT domain-containing protein n=1 Tax=Actinomadura sp. 7K507 TaxID=2530365 RepID=UPI001FB60978|nr:MHYT domain-containing protein [Actinomadura sp. 7K507]
MTAYAMSFIGSLLGLLCTTRARAAGGLSRASWLALAALAIGGTGIWVMHFIAMLGFTVQDHEIRYDVPLTLLSCATSIAVVGIGLFIVGFAGIRVPMIVTGGLIMGAGVASMHYTGMEAMNMAGHIGYQPILVGLSVLIALVAATAALWFSIRVKGMWATAGAAAIMGIAVTGMHYTGMAAMEITMHEGMADPTGARAIDFLLPLMGGVGGVSIILLIIIAMAPSEEEIRVEAQLHERIRARQEAERQRTDAPRTPAEPAAPPAPSRTAGEWFDGGPGR